MFINNNYNAKEVAARIIQNCDMIVANKKPCKKRSQWQQVNVLDMPIPQTDLSLLETFKYTYEMCMDKIGIPQNENYRKNLRYRLSDIIIKDIDYIKLPIKLSNEAIVRGMEGISRNTRVLFSERAIEKTRKIHEKGKLK